MRRKHLKDQRIEHRKIEHIEVVLNHDVDFPNHCTNLYDAIILIHQAYPRINYEEIDLSTYFLGYKLSAPIIIEAMTGGHPDTYDINEKLAELASELGLAIGVGSQRPMIIYRNNDEVIKTYKVVREIAENVPLIGNIGANTLHDLVLEDIEWLVKTINADALAIHFNPAQEAIQPEGDLRFSEKISEKIAEMLDLLDVPLIIKEVGNGLSMETVSKLRSIGVRIFDVAGACGTNWILVEKYRKRTTPIKQAIAELLARWGIPTPISVIETRAAAPDSIIIASGGVWDGLKAVKSIAIGADMIGLAKPIIKKLLLENYISAKKYLETIIESMRIIMFLTGARKINDLHKIPIILLEPYITYLKTRGINPDQYIKYLRGS